MHLLSGSLNGEGIKGIAGQFVSQCPMSLDVHLLIGKRIKNAFLIDLVLLAVKRMHL